VLNKLKWGILALLTVLLLATYGTVSLQVLTLTDLFLSVAPKLSIALLTMLAAKAFLELTSPLLERHAASPELRPTTTKLWSLLIWSAACLVILSIFIGDLSALLVSAGLVGFGLTFALQKPILSLVGWLNIMWKRLYSPGDSVQIGGLEGDVISVDLLTTTLLDQEGGRQVTFPNLLVLEQAVANFTKDTPYVWDEVAVSVSPSEIPAMRTRLLRASDEVLGNKKMAANIKEYNSALGRFGLKSPSAGPEVLVDITDSGARLRLRYMVNLKVRNEAKSAISERVLAARQPRE